MDPSVLYFTGDRAFITWTQALCDRVEELRRQQRAAQKTAGG